MGPQIQAKLAAKKKRRQVILWWLPLGLVTITAFCYLLAVSRQPNLAYFPIAVGNALTNEIASVSFRSGYE
jgi:cytochrome c-type biogenesis protein CcmH/NrfF